MTSMVERVALAVREAVQNSPERNISFEEMSFIVARAAIEEMREPTDAMEAAGGLKAESIMFEGDKEGTGVIFNDMGCVFNSMIDAALNEQVAG